MRAYMSDIKVGAFVKVVSGAAFLPGRRIMGRVLELFDGAAGTPAALVKVASGGEWGFNVRDLRVLPKRDVA